MAQTNYDHCKRGKISNIQKRLSERQPLLFYSQYSLINDIAIISKHFTNNLVNTTTYWNFSLMEITDIITVQV